MKNIFLVVFLIFIAISCSKENDKQTIEPTPTIIGKWQLIKGETKQGQNIISTQAFDPLPNCVRNFIEIKSGTSLNNVIHSSPCVENSQEFQYTYSNGILNYGNIDRKVEKLTSTELITSEQSGQFQTLYTYQKAQ